MGIENCTFHSCPADIFLYLEINYLDHLQINTNEYENRDFLSISR